MLICIFTAKCSAYFVIAVSTRNSVGKIYEVDGSFVTIDGIKSGGTLYLKINSDRYLLINSCVDISFFLEVFYFLTSQLGMRNRVATREEKPQPKTQQRRALLHFPLGIQVTLPSPDESLNTF